MRRAVFFFFCVVWFGRECAVHFSISCVPKKKKEMFAEHYFAQHDAHSFPRRRLRVCEALDHALKKNTKVTVEHYVTHTRKDT